MGIAKKIGTAFKILKQKGLAGFWHTVQQQIVALTCTDETEIIFDVLQSYGSKGVLFDVGAHHG